MSKLCEPKNSKCCDEDFECCSDDGSESDSDCEIIEERDIVDFAKNPQVDPVTHKPLDLSSKRFKRLLKAAAKGDPSKKIKLAKDAVEGKATDQPVKSSRAMIKDIEVNANHEVERFIESNGLRHPVSGESLANNRKLFLKVQEAAIRAVRLSNNFDGDQDAKVKELMKLPNRERESSTLTPLLGELPELTGRTLADSGNAAVKQIQVYFRQGGEKGGVEARIIGENEFNTADNFRLNCDAYRLMREYVQSVHIVTVADPRSPFVYFHMRAHPTGETGIEVAEEYSVVSAQTHKMRKAKRLVPDYPYPSWNVFEDYMYSQEAKVATALEEEEEEEEEEEKEELQAPEPPPHLVTEHSFTTGNGVVVPYVGFLDGPFRKSGGSAARNAYIVDMLRKYRAYFGEAGP